MSNYLYAELENNSFKVVADGSVLGYNFKGASFKIDTGCSYSTIPCSRLMIYNKSELEQLKKFELEVKISIKLVLTFLNYLKTDKTILVSLFILFLSFS